MENKSGPRNRKERRAQAREEGNEVVSLKQPSRDAPKQKTLIDIAAERELIPNSTSSSPKITTTKINSDGSLSTDGSGSAAERAESAPYLDIFLYTSTLTILHLTFTVLVHNQFAIEPPSLPSLLYKSTIASPTPLLLVVLVALLHPRSGHPAVQALFAASSITCGMWLVRTTNEGAYLATMQKAPPLGTLWVWTVVELRWEFAAGCLAFVAGWGWWFGYRIT